MVFRLRKSSLGAAMNDKENDGKAGRTGATVLGPVPKRDELVRCFGDGRIAILRTNGTIDYYEASDVIEDDRVAHMFFSFTPGNAFK